MTVPKRMSMVFIHPVASSQRLISFPPKDAVFSRIYCLPAVVGQLAQGVPPEWGERGPER